VTDQPGGRGGDASDDHDHEEGVGQGRRGEPDGSSGQDAPRTEELPRQPSGDEGSRTQGAGGRGGTGSGRRAHRVTEGVGGASPGARDQFLVESAAVAADEPPGMRPPGRRYLLDTERRVIFRRRHPALLLRYVFETLGALLLAGLLTKFLPHPIVDVLWYAVLLVIARLLYQVSEWSVDRFVVTDRRMMLITGLLTRKVGMMPLAKVTDMTFERSVLGRVLGYGEFIMESAGQEQALRRINYVPAPDRLYREVSELLFGGPGGGLPGVLPPTAKVPRGLDADGGD